MSANDLVATNGFLNDFGNECPYICMSVPVYACLAVSKSTTIDKHSHQLTTKE
jgi:hypothetical protein